MWIRTGGQLINAANVARFIVRADDKQGDFVLRCEYLGGHSSNITRYGSMTEALRALDRLDGVLAGSSPVVVAP